MPPGVAPSRARAGSLYHERLRVTALLILHARAGRQDREKRTETTPLAAIFAGKARRPRCPHSSKLTVFWLGSSCCLDSEHSLGKLESLPQIPKAAWRAAPQRADQRAPAERRSGGARAWLRLAPQVEAARCAPPLTCPRVLHAMNHSGAEPSCNTASPGNRARHVRTAPPGRSRRPRSSKNAPQLPGPLIFCRGIAFLRALSRHQRSILPSIGVASATRGHAVY